MKNIEIRRDTIIDLMNFQLLYLNKLMENIPDERLYEKQLDGLNSAGWILGHICVEANDVIKQLNRKESFEELDLNWEKWFKSSTGKIESINKLPNKAELITIVNERYIALGKAYLNLTVEQQNSLHPSKFLREVLTTFDSWYAHHLTTHIAMHCGNIVVWKKVIGLPVNGF